MGVDKTAGSVSGGTTDTLKIHQKKEKRKQNTRDDFFVSLHLLLRLLQQYVIFQHIVKQHFQCVKGLIPTYFTAPMHELDTEAVIQKQEK